MFACKGRKGVGRLTCRADISTHIQTRACFIIVPGEMSGSLFTPIHHNTHTQTHTHLLQNWAQCLVLHTAHAYVHTQTHTLTHIHTHTLTHTHTYTHTLTCFSTVPRELSCPLGRRAKGERTTLADANNNGPGSCSSILEATCTEVLEELSTPIADSLLANSCWCCE